MRTKALQIIYWSFLIYIVSWILVYKTGLNTFAIVSEDTLPAMFLPVSIIKDKTLYADNYVEMIIAKYPHPDDKDYRLGLVPFYFRKVGGHYISAFPIITGLLAVPVYFFPLILGLPITWENITLLAHISSALIVSVSGGLFFLLAKAYTIDDKKAAILTAVYLFASINFALISNGLWQHGTVQLFIIIFLYLLYKKQLFYAGIAMGLAILSRPTALLFLPFLTLLVNLRNFKQLLLYSLGGMCVFLFFMWYTNLFYMGLENNGYTSQILEGWESRFPEGFLGMWFSPSKGILVYSPIFIFSFVGVWLIFKNKSALMRENFKYFIFLVLIVLHTLVLGKWKHWYGGWGFGYRMAADIIPFLVLLIVPFLTSEYFKKYKRFFWVLLFFSIAVQFFGLLFFDGVWHAAYDGGYTDTAWLWSLKDSEFSFTIRRLLVKLGSLEKACPTCLS